MSINNPKVCILILNWNGWQDTIECLESVFRISYPAYQVVVVDNGSTNGSMDYIKMWAEGKIDVYLEPDNPLRRLSNPPVQKPIPYRELDRQTLELDLYRENDLSLLLLNRNKSLVLIQTDSNLGFAGGNNVGIRYALERGVDYVLLLNNDTVVDKNFLGHLLKAAMCNKNNGIVGGKMYFYDKPNRIQAVGGRILLTKGKNSPIGCGEPDHGQYNKIAKADFVPGALMLIKSEVFRNVGLFDEKFFCYAEDVDLCYRASIAGYKILVKPKSQIWHKVSASSGGRLSNTFLYYSFRNKIFFLKKHFPKKHFLLILPVILKWIIKSIYCLRTNRLDGIKLSIKGIIHGIFNIYRKKEGKNAS